MSSAINQNHHYPHRPKREPNETLYPPSPSPPTLKIKKDSHVIRNQPYPSSSSSAPRPRITYTHPPRIIHTHPKDFMALVQKLTGVSPSHQDPGGNTMPDRAGKSINQSVGGHDSHHRNYSGTGNRERKLFKNTMIREDRASSSVMRPDENIGAHGQVSSSLLYSAVAIPPPLPPSMYGAAGINYGANGPIFPIFPLANPGDNFLRGPFANLDDPLYFAPNIGSSFSSSSSSGFDGFPEFRDF